MLLFVLQVHLHICYAIPLSDFPLYLSQRWAVDFDEAACNTSKFNNPETQVCCIFIFI